MTARALGLSGYIGLTAALIAIAVVSPPVSAATPTPTWRGFDSATTLNYQPVSVGRYGKACRLQGGSKLGPPSYRVADIDEPGVPKLTIDQRAMVHRIEEYVGDATLWFAFVRDSFTVFDASGYPDAPPCVYTPLGYVVENDPCDCYYQSGEEDSITLGPGDTPVPKPWFTTTPNP
jgi:hypothetical protein